MRILVDTHAFVWWILDDKKLSNHARELLDDRANEVLVSAVVAWEAATKSRLGKWPEGRIVADNVDGYVARYALVLLPISVAHARRGGLMPGEHRDPFDRLLAAQAEIEGVPLVTSDRVFRAFGTRTLW
jgi:PIN domain nuclease of toxin-antitoxin system